MTTVDLLQCIRDLTDAGLCPGGVDREREQVVVQIAARSTLCGRGEAGESCLAGLLVALGAELLELGDLLGPHAGVLDLEDLDLLVLFHDVLVDADDGLAAGVDTRLGAGRGLLDAQLGDALPDGLGHAAGLLDLEEMQAGLVGELCGEPLDVVRTRPRVDRTGGVRLLLQQ